MFGARWQIFRLFGIPLFLDISWLIILALLTWTVAESFREELPGRYWADYGIMGLIAAIAFFVCILLHEMGHAVVAQYSGMPVRGITLFMFGGVAELGGEPPSAGHEFAVAIGGPLVSVVLGVGFFFTSLLGVQANWPDPVVVILAYLAQINFVVLAFNLVPAFPLDGGRVLRSLLWGVTGNLRQATYWASLAGQVFAWFLILMGVLQLLTGNFVGGMWMGLIGLFLRAAAQGGYQQVLVQQALEGEPVRHFMNTEPVVVSPSLDLQQWVEDYVYRHHRKSFPVVADGHLQGIVTTRDLAKCPREQWESHTVADLMRRDVQAVSIAPDAEALDALRKMERTGSSRLLVTDGDQLVGIVSLKDLLRFLRLKIGLDELEE
jgi:Zn-dependent protease/CBS domain-containing protein